MELLEAIRSRRTARVFRPDPVSDQDLMTILEAGTWAPSHNNTQPWEFIVIGPETRNKLLGIYRQMMEGGPLQDPSLPEERKELLRNFIQNFGGAPLIVAVVHPPATTDLDRSDFPLADAAAIQNISLAAWGKGIASVWLSFGIAPPVRATLGVPDGGGVAGILALGYSDMIPPAQPRVPVSEKLRRLP